MKEIIVTTRWLNAHDACDDGVARFKRVHGTSAPLVDVIEGHITDGTLDYANWLIVREMAYRQYVSYAVFAAEQVIDIYEAKYPDDSRPRMAIEAAKKCIEHPTRANKSAADAAAHAVAYAAAYAAHAADAADAARAAELKTKIINYGMQLIGEGI